MTADTPTIPMRPDDNDNNNARINDELVPAFRARYAPPDEELPDADLAAARADLSLLAGVAAA